MGALVILVLAITIIAVWLDWLRRSFSRTRIEDAYRNGDSGNFDEYSRAGGNFYVASIIVLAALSGVVMLGVIALTYSILADAIPPMRDPF